MNFIQRAQGYLRRRESFRTGMMKLFHLLDFRASKESRNPLPELTPQVAKRLYEYYRQGKYADVMLTWEAMEEVDDILGVIVDKRYSALKEMDSGVKIDSESVGDDPVLQRLAEEQQDMLSRCYASIENLQEGIQTMASASFRGFAMLEPIRRGKSIRLEPVHQWLMARPVRGGAWYYNADANSSCARLEEVDTSLLLIREVERPINIPVMFAICAKAHTIDGWDGLIDVFGNPAIFFEMPPGTSDERAEEYDGVAKRIIGDGRGSFPSGGKITTVETQARNGDIFFQRAEWCEKQIVRRGTGGLLTVMTEAGSGTLAGNAHQETFRQIAAAEGSDISECFNKQFSASLLNRYFPGMPHLAYWSLEFAAEEDTDKKVDRVTRLASAGYVADEQEVAELSGLTVKYQAPAGGIPSQLPMMNRMAAPALVTNTETTTEPLLSPEELELLTALTKVMPKTKRIEAEAKSLENALKNAIKDFAPDGSSEEASPGASPLHVAGMGDEEEALVYNYGTSAGAKKGWDKRGRGKRDDWQSAREGMTPRQNAANATRAMRWSTNNGKDALKVMHRKGLGWVDFPFGRPGTKKPNEKGVTHSDGYGISHILDKHGERALRRMPLILSYGKVKPHSEPNKVTVEYGNEVVHLGRSKGKGKSWAITSYDKGKGGKKDDY